MNFYDTVAEKGYAIKKEENTNIVHLIKDDASIIEIHIIFYMSEKQITGFLKPKDLFKTLDDMCIIYRVFLTMQRDIKFFADRSKYDII